MLFGCAWISGRGNHYQRPAMGAGARPAINKLAREQMAKDTGASIEGVERLYHRESGETNQTDWQ
jgi:hypothetical protein